MSPNVTWGFSDIRLKLEITTTTLKTTKFSKKESQLTSCKRSHVEELISIFSVEAKGASSPCVGSKAASRCC